MRFRQINEGFEWVFKGENAEEQVQRLKQWASTNQAIVPVVRHGVGAEKADWGVPDGMPTTVKFEDDTPEGLGATSISLEWRRISGFITANSNIKNLKQAQREMVWVQILEGVHPVEAKILTHVKDGTLLEMYPTLETLLPTLGIKEYNKPVVKKAKRKPRAKKS